MSSKGTPVQKDNPTRVSAVVPRLRFPEFHNGRAWRSAHIGEIFETASGGTPDRSQKKYWGGGIPWISTSLVNFNHIEKAEEFVTEEGLKNSSAKIFPPGTILIAMYGQGKTRGQVAILDIAATTNQACAAVLPKEGIIPEFIFLALSNRYEELRDLSNSGGQENLSQTLIRGFSISIPWDIEEQTSVADCLSSANELIAAETRKLESLKAHKQGLMQQLFPAEGETVPRFRFPAFKKDGEWKTRKIGDVLFEVSRPIDLEDEQEYSLVIVKRRYGGIVPRGQFQGKAVKVKSQSHLQEDDFLISKRQIVHCACGLVSKDFEGAIVSNEYSILRAKPGNHIGFFSYFAQQPEVSESFLTSSVGIVIEKMLFRLNHWLRREFVFPSFEEQAEIAKCLFSIEHMISLQERKVDFVRTHKSGLIKQLFPVMDEVQS
jgi:type I restriction enzyme, S subunit